MNIILCGASGMIASALIPTLSKHSLTLVSRTPLLISEKHSNIKCISWDNLTLDTIHSCDVIINLAGENIGASRWSRKRKLAILQSRITTTTKVATLCQQLGNDSPRILNASAISIYGLAEDNTEDLGPLVTEDTPEEKAPSSFLSDVSLQWEACLDRAESSGAKVVRLRFSVVLDCHKGALAKMIPAFRYGLGPILGNGHQAFSWVCLADVTRAINFILDHPQLSGGINVVAKEVVSQKSFAKTLSRSLNRPQFLRLPKWIIQLLFGQMGNELLLKGQNVRGDRLRDLGFNYHFDTLSDAMKNLTSTF